MFAMTEEKARKAPSFCAPTEQFSGICINKSKYLRFHNSHISAKKSSHAITGIMLIVTKLHTTTD